MDYNVIPDGMTDQEFIKSTLLQVVSVPRADFPVCPDMEPYFTWVLDNAIARGNVMVVRNIIKAIQYMLLAGVIPFHDGVGQMLYRRAARYEYEGESDD